MEHFGGKLLNNSQNSVCLSNASLLLSSMGVSCGAAGLERDNSLRELVVSSFRGFEPGELEQPEVQDAFDFDSDEEYSELFEQETVKKLCGDLVDEVFDEDSYQNLQGCFDFQRKGKFGAKSLKRKTCKVNLSCVVKKVSK